MNWNPEEHDRRLRMVETVLGEGCTPPNINPRPGKRAAYVEAAERLNISTHALREYFLKHPERTHPDWTIYDRWCEENPLQACDSLPQDVERTLRAEVAQRDRLIRSLREQLQAQEEDDAERRLASSMRFTPYTVSPETHTADSPGFPMTIWSDWHWGETVDAREMGGLNVFNREVAFERVEKLVNNTVKLIRDYSGRNPTFPGIWVCLGGDLISGGIHEELRETNWGTIEEQSYEVGGALAGALLRMADEFGQVYVPCVVGNHGRHSFKPVAKRHVRENREWGIYKSLEAQFEDDPRFHFFIPDDVDFLFEVYGNRFLLTHGDTLGVKGGDGFIGAVGPIRRGSLKIGGAEAQIGRTFDYMIIGHWHAYQPAGALVPTIVNGTFKGFDEYARTMLRVPYGKPIQALWYASPKHGLVNQTGVDLS